MSYHHEFRFLDVKEETSSIGVFLEGCQEGLCLSGGGSAERDVIGIVEVRECDWGLVAPFVGCAKAGDNGDARCRGDGKVHDAVKYQNEQKGCKCVALEYACSWGERVSGSVGSVDKGGVALVHGEDGGDERLWNMVCFERGSDGGPGDAGKCVGVVDKCEAATAFAVGELFIEVMQGDDVLHSATLGAEAVLIPAKVRIYDRREAGMEEFVVELCGCTHEGNVSPAGRVAMVGTWFGNHVEHGFTEAGGSCACGKAVIHKGEQGISQFWEFEIVGEDGIGTGGFAPGDPLSKFARNGRRNESLLQPIAAQHREH